ncbi:helix-turn-helix domain-containing protein [Streptomyces yaizuensis]|uniref:TetR/AcrR family transcriptional regulator n=1 Tax=Streptomyces yaizuensis TaxID=2989713 RepID=A0ABQ5P885_9ACTN|nr:helix-turn-helix domain-containing protein [Streptomyces sp. YSPA8]GLF98785.1 TetR/AcrR family transcriptional regulator [Streptomyces sp. YSPA8]
MRKRSAATREVLLSAAAEAFEQSGFGETRLEDVVAGHDVSKGALYFHFPSKEALAAAVIDAAYGPWPERLELLRPAYPRAMARLVALGRQIIDAYRSDAGMRAGLRLMTEVSSATPALARPLVDGLAAVEGLLAEAAEQGDLLPGTDVRRTARLILAGFTGLPRIPGRGNEPAPSADAPDPLVPAERTDVTERADVTELAELAELTELADDMTGLWLALLPGLVRDECRAELTSVLTGDHPSS